MTLSRRALVTSLAAAAVASTAMPGRASAVRAKAPAFDPDDPAQVRHAMRRMRYSTAPDTFYWWMRGTRYAVIDTRPVPLFEMNVGTIMRCRDVGEDFEVTSLEVVFNTDPATGKLIEQWPNPFTGETLEMRVAPVGPTTMRYGPDGPRSTPQLPGSTIENTQRSRRPVVEGDDLWIDSESIATVTPNGGGKAFRVADLSTYHARVSQVLDPKVAFVDTEVAYNDVTDWPRWMKMGDRPGHRFARAAGRKVRSWDAMPARWRDLVTARFPTIAANPERAIDLPPFRFER
jgi:hypothetical protein